MMADHETKQKEESAKDEIEHLAPKKTYKQQATRQKQARRRNPPRAPGWFPVEVDNVITMTIEFALIITAFLVIFTSFTYSGDDLGWIIFFEIVFTYGGFAYFVRQISKQILIYKKFFESLNQWHDARLQSIKDGDGSCCCIWFILLTLAWWIVALLIFPFIIGWSMIQSFKLNKDRRRNAKSTVDLTQLENVSGSVADARQYWKMTDHAYSVWHLGVLSKQASMIVMLIQDIPLLVLSVIVVNYLGIIVFSVSIVVKLLSWAKHMYDLGRLTLFYKPEHYMKHFGIKSILWNYEFGCAIILITFFDEYEQELNTLQVADWVQLYDEKKEEWNVMIVWKNQHFKKEENLVLVDWDKVDPKAIEEFDKGLAKKIMIDEELIHTVNRWDGNVILLRDAEYSKYHDNAGRDEDDIVMEEKVDMVVVEIVEGNTNKTNNVTQVVHVTDGDKKSDEHVNKSNNSTEDKYGESKKLEDVAVNDTMKDVQKEYKEQVKDEEFNEEDGLMKTQVNKEYDANEDEDDNVNGYQAVPLNADDDDDDDTNVN